MNKGDIEDLKKAAQNLIKYLNESCNPHTIVIVQQGTIALYSGECFIKTEVPD